MRSMLGAPLLALVSLLLPFATQAQTQADCTFNFISLQTTLTLSDGTPVFVDPLGINDFGTIVGATSVGTPRGLIRWANGSVTHVKGTSALTARNDHGASVGWGLTVLEGILANSTTVTPIVLDVNNGGITEVNGINRWGTIIGRYIPPDFDSSNIQAFLRFNNGTTHTLEFPGAAEGHTDVLGINDNGFVVGKYNNSDYVWHGLIFHKGTWATLDYPNTSDDGSYTFLIGISNAGKIIGKAFVRSSRTPFLFLYENGTFKVISIPHADPSLAELRSISPKLGLILGVTGDPANPAFIAQCQ
jgi:hypothetical protein